VNNVLHGRYEKPSDDLKRLLLGRYGPFPFYEPQEWIFQKVLEHQRSDGRRWFQILAEEAGIQRLKDEDFDKRRSQLELDLQRSVSDEELCLYPRCFPGMSLRLFPFRGSIRQTMAAPPDVWYRRGGFEDGSRVTFSDYEGKTHHIDIVSTRRSGNEVHTSLLVDYHFQTYTSTVAPGKAV